MASVYENGSRAYWYAKIRDPKKKGANKWRSVVTPFKIASPAGKRKAMEWAGAQDRVGKEKIRGARIAGWTWVMPWLNQSFGYNRNTLVRYLTAWAHLNEFFGEHDVRGPLELMYRHASDYIAWRTAQVRPRGTTINHNTALTEAKVMSRILQEARKRELIEANPWAQLGIRRQNVQHTPAMTLNEIETWRAALVAKEGHLPIGKRWMTVCFETALSQAVRLKATQVPMTRVHLDDRTKGGVNFDRITFEEKGRNGAKKIKTLPVNPRLRPLLLELRDAGAEWTCELPRMAAKLWWQFRKANGLGHLRFHSTRSTAATELARRNVSKQKAMEILGHKSEAVHQAYLHLNAEDVADELAELRFDKPGPAGSPGAPSPTRSISPPSSEGRPETGSPAPP